MVLPQINLPNKIRKQHRLQQITHLLRPRPPKRIIMIEMTSLIARLSLMIKETLWNVHSLAALYNYPGRIQARDLKRQIRINPMPMKLEMLSTFLRIQNMKLEITSLHVMFMIQTLIMIRKAKAVISLGESTSQIMVEKKMIVSL